MTLRAIEKGAGRPPPGNSPQQHQALGLQESQPIPQQVAAALSERAARRRCRQGRLAAGALAGASLPGGRA